MSNAAYDNAVAQSQELMREAKVLRSECAALSRYIRHDAPRHVKEIALGWTEDDEREPA